MSVMMPLMRRCPRVARATFASLAAGDDVSKLGAREVAVKMVASPITSAGTMSGVGVVTAVGSSVKGLAVDDVVLSAGSLGAFRPVVNAPAASVFKVPAGVPAEYACLLADACTAAALLKGVQAGEVVVQSGADTLVGQAVVQLAKAKGVLTINVVKTSPDEAEMVDLIKSLGGDVVAPGFYAKSSKFRALVADLPKPVLAITYAGPLDDASLATKVPAAGSAVSKLRPLVAGASSGDLSALKVAGTVASLASNTASHGPLAASPVAWGADEVAEVARLIKAEELALWVEKYPLVDLEYASKRATEPYPGFRAMVLNF